MHSKLDEFMNKENLSRKQNQPVDEFKFHVSLF